MLHAFVFSAEAFPVRNRAKDAGTEQTIALRLEGTVVDRLRLGNFTMRPGTDLVRRSETDSDRLIVCSQLRLAFVIKSKHSFLQRVSRVNQVASCEALTL